MYKNQILKKWIPLKTRRTEEFSQRYSSILYFTLSDFITLAKDLNMDYLTLLSWRGKIKYTT